MQAMILAAGLGTRLRPLTEHRPKPLFPVLNRPLIHRLLAQLEQAGCGHIVINSHHLATMLLGAIESWGLTVAVTVLVEPRLLGTGGALRNALPYLDPTGPLLVVNGDLVTDVDFRQIWLAHQGRMRLGTLVVHDRPPWNKLAVDGGVVVGFDSEQEGSLAFTGISVLDRSLLERIPPDRPSSLIETFASAVEIDRESLSALRVDATQQAYLWGDIGTPEGYLGAHASLLSCSQVPFLIAGDVRLPPDRRLQGWACVGAGARLGSGVTLRRSVVWPETAVPSGLTLEDSIATPFGILKSRRSGA